MEIHVTSSVEELCDEWFSIGQNLSRVTSSEPSSLKRIGQQAFFASSVTDIDIPDSVE